MYTRFELHFCEIKICSLRLENQIRKVKRCKTCTLFKIFINTLDHLMHVNNITFSPFTAVVICFTVHSRFDLLFFFLKASFVLSLSLFLIKLHNRIIPNFTLSQSHSFHEITLPPNAHIITFIINIDLSQCH